MKQRLFWGGSLIYAMIIATAAVCLPATIGFPEWMRGLWLGSAAVIWMMGMAKLRKG